MDLIPVLGCVVKKRAVENSRGIVTKHGEPSASNICVFWTTPNKEKTWVKITDIDCGHKAGGDVEHTPLLKTESSLGYGRILRIQQVAGITLALTEFSESGVRRWLPWQSLRRHLRVDHGFLRNELQTESAVDRSRLRTLAWAISLWNENTGALTKFEIDPLPHQINLVHHILASGNYNWLIADDVGLGKTVELGLLLSALRQRGEVKRVLLITPAGLTRQWQEEMAGKFGIEEFRIYGKDFVINDSSHWKMQDYVIGSMDMLKAESHLEILMQADNWDLVVVDEAHRLTRKITGNRYSSSERYKLISALRKRSENIVLLTATPHQGREDTFRSLLEVIRPDQKENIDTLSLNPEIIGDMIFRNYKANVTDQHGNFIFHGTTVKQIHIPANEALVEFDKKLRKYLIEGFNAEAKANSTKGFAIGFVMTIYRKLAASSVAAIHRALVRRLAKLEGEAEQKSELVIDVEDERYQGEIEEFRADGGESQFFVGEIELLKQLIDSAAELKSQDPKLKQFSTHLIDEILKGNSSEKVLIFSEYRTTQDWISSELTRKFGEDSTVLIHGGMRLDERRAVIDSFDSEDGAQFLISTEAGGEGINLQERCHIMINYDLPWNPMRLVQRIGRLYRYGQQKRVVVFNLHQKDSADEEILLTLYDRINTVATELATVNHNEFNESLHNDIVGELSDLVDVEEILYNSANQSIERTEEQIDKALGDARTAAQRQHELFTHAASYNPNETSDELKITLDHLKAFVAGMCEYLNIEILAKKHNESVWELRLSEQLKDQLSLTKALWEVTFDRKLATKREKLQLMAIGNWLFDYLIKCAKTAEFGGYFGALKTNRFDARIAAIIRHQTLSGKRARQELIVMDQKGAATEFNTSEASEWLLQKQISVVSNVNYDFDKREVIKERIDRSIEDILKKKSSERLLPEVPQWISANLGIPSE